MSNQLLYTINKAILLLFVYFGSSYSFAQHPVSTKVQTNPKIGLVLSGGGALGLAHIGVLKVLEEKGIKPDYIVGTSMGSIVGGLYALGYSASEIEKKVNTTDWDLILAQNIPLNMVVHDEKYDYGRYLIKFPFKNRKPKLPSGLIEGQLLTEDLIKNTWSSINYKSFDDFPIPFRCIGTNVSNGEEIIFKDGSLGIAMRASMAIPTVFSAVNLDSTLIVDGGVVNNYPVDVAFDMGADYVIGIDVTSGYHQAFDIDNMVGILYQISMFQSLEKQQENIKNTDVYLHPDVSEFGSSDFRKSEKIIESGVAIATLEVHKIDSLLEAINYQAHPVVRQVALTSDSILVESVNFHSSIGKSDFHLVEKLHRDSNSMVSISEFQQDLHQLYGTNKYKSIHYWAKPQFDSASNSPFPSKFTLEIQAEENPNSNLSIGLHFDNTFGFGIIGNFTSYNLLGKNSRLRFVGDISENPKMELELKKYLGKRKNINIIANYRFLSLEQPSYTKGELSGYQQNNISLAELKVENNTGINRNVSAGYMYLFDGSTVKLGNENLKNFNVKNGYHSLFAQYDINSFNRNYHPTQGLKLFLRADLNLFNHLTLNFPSGVDEITIENGGDTLTISEHEFNQIIQNDFIPESPYVSIVAKYKHIWKLNSKFNFISDIATGLTLGQTETDNLYRAFNVGGNINLFYYDFNLYGLRYAEDLTNNIGIIRADIQYSPVKKVILYGGANFGFFSNSGFRINSFSQDFKTFTANELFGYGFNFVYLSPIGPLEIGPSWNNQDPYTRWNVSFGFQF